MHTNAAAILRLFHSETGFVSGEMISRSLGVTRSAVWKHINALRKTGYRIDAVSSLGYRLVQDPGKIDPHEIGLRLSGLKIGKRIEYFQNTASTNSQAFTLAEESAVEGTVVLADAQSSGKGRRGRTWESPAGVNLYCSILLRPAVMPHEASQLTFLSAVAVAAAIRSTTGLKSEIKWPNDILINGKKVAGLLNEMSAETDGINFVILGIGVNLNMTEDQFPEGLRNPATSLAIELGKPVDRSGFAVAMLAEIDRLYNEFISTGFSGIREKWENLCTARGRQIEVSDSGTAFSRGCFQGVDNDGALLLKTEDGTIHRIISGDMRIL